jgi:hypothetical protein
MKKFTLIKRLFATLGLIIVATMGWAQSQQIHYFNFNDNVPGTNVSWPQSVPAKIGSGTLTHDFTQAYSFGGTVLNGNTDEVNGGSFVPRGGVEMVNNGRFFTLHLSTKGYRNIVLSYPTQRTATGFSTQTIEYTINGTEWIQKQVITEIPTAWAVYTIDFSDAPAVNDNEKFAVRFTLTGSTAEAGNNRFDNISLTGETIPTPLAGFATDFYLLFDKSKDAKPAWMIDANANRGITAYGDNVYVAHLTGNKIHIHDAQSGDFKQTLTLTGLISGLQTIGFVDIEADDEGKLLIGNLASDGATPQEFRVYTLNGSAATLVLSFPMPLSATNVGDGRLGDKFTLTGKISDKSAVIYAVDAKAGKNKIFKFSMLANPTDNILFGAPEVITLGTATGPSAKVAPIPGGGFYFTGGGVGVSKLNADGSLVGTISTTLIAVASTSLEYIAKDGNDDIIAVYHWGANAERVRIVRVKDGNPATSEVIYDSPMMNNTDTNLNASGLGDVAVLEKDGGFNIYVVGANTGVLGVTNIKPTNIYSVTFDIKDAANQPLNNATVTFNGKALAMGTYAVLNQQPGQYAYSISAPGYITATGTATIVDQNITVPVTMAVQPTYTVTFDIKHNDTPVTNATVTFNGTALAEGVYTTAAVVPGTYTYKIVAEGFEDAVGNVVITDANVNQVVSLTARKTRFAVTFDIKNAQGVAIQGAVVTLNAVTNPAGNYVFEEMLPGTYNYSINATGYHVATGSVVVVDGDITASVTMEALDYADPLTINTYVDFTGNNIPTEVGSAGLARSAALYKDRYVIVPSRVDGPNVWVFDTKNPHLEPVALKMGTGIIEFGFALVNYVEIVGDDIYVSNLTLQADATHPFRVYRWSSLEAEPELVLSANGGWGRLGDAFSILGDPRTNGSIVAHRNNNTETENLLRRQFRKWDFAAGELVNVAPTTIELNIEGTANLNSFGIMKPVEGEDNLYIATGNGAGFALADLSGDVKAYMAGPVFSVSAVDPNIFYHNGRRFLSYVVNNATLGSYYEVIDITPGATVVEAFKKINSVNVLDARRVHRADLGAGAASLGGTNRIYKSDNEVKILTFVGNRGFILETTGIIPAKYALTIAVAPAEMGTATGSGDYFEGATVPVKAVVNAGYQFKNWTIAEEVVSTQANFTYTMPAAPITLMANFEDIPVTEIKTLAELRDLPADGNVYKYTGTAVIVAMDSNRNRKYIQDHTAAIQIDDNAGIITTVYNLYDNITNITGKVNIIRNMVQFIPTENTVASVSNTPVEPLAIKPQDVTQDDQAKLIKLQSVTFADVAAGAKFEQSTNYQVTDGTNTFVVRTDLFASALVGELIPTELVNITGVVITFNEELQLVPRLKTDIQVVTSVSNPVEVAVNIFPNPARNVVNITSGAMIRGMIITDLTGKVVYNNTINDFQVRIQNQMETGLYIVRLYTDGGVVVKKLQIQK